MPIYRDNTFATTEQQDLLIYIGPDMPPFLIVPGDADRTVPLNQSQFLYQALRIAGLDAMLYVVDGAGHDFREASERQLAKIGGWVDFFFDRHLKERI
jgi:dipeptidyl aminopeptidase/acylaminoacyl peptidase